MFENLFKSAAAEFQKYSGPPISTSWGDRIPDFFSKDTMAELKNVGYQYLSRQLRGLMEIADAQKKQFVLVVREGTKLSQPLKDKIAEVGGQVWALGESGITVLKEVGSAIGSGLDVVPMIAPADFLDVEKMNCEVMGVCEGDFMT